MKTQFTSTSWHICHHNQTGTQIFEIRFTNCLSLYRNIPRVFSSPGGIYSQSLPIIALLPTWNVSWSSSQSLALVSPTVNLPLHSKSAGAGKASYTIVSMRCERFPMSATELAFFKNSHLLPTIRLSRPI